MKISTKGRYALRLMIDLAQRGENQFVSLRDVSSRQEISIKYLEQITNQLIKAGLLKSVRGPSGGYKLSKEASEYTVGDILRVTEGNLAPVACLEDTVNLCGRRETCATLGFWEGLYDVINAYVDSVTLEEIAKKDCDAFGSDFVI